MSRMDDPMSTGSKAGGSKSGGSSSGTESGGGAGAMKDTASQVQQNLRELGTQARDVAQQRFDDLRQQANDYYETGRQRATEYEQNLEQYVQDQPVKALAIAAGVGSLPGALWKRS